MINGTSNAYAMTGWRIGYAVGPAQLIDVIVKMIGQSTTCASSVGQAAGLVALTSDQTCLAEAAPMYRPRRDRMLELNSVESGLYLVARAGAVSLNVSVAVLVGGRAHAVKPDDAEIDTK